MGLRDRIQFNPLINSLSLVGGSTSLSSWPRKYYQGHKRSNTPQAKHSKYAIVGAKSSSVTRTVICLLHYKLNVSDFWMLVFSTYEETLQQEMVGTSKRSDEMERESWAGGQDYAMIQKMPNLYYLPDKV